MEGLTRLAVLYLCPLVRQRHGCGRTPHLVVLHLWLHALPHSILVMCSAARAYQFESESHCFPSFSSSVFTLQGPVHSIEDLIGDFMIDGGRNRFVDLLQDGVKLFSVTSARQPAGGTASRGGLRSSRESSGGSQEAAALGYVAGSAAINGCWLSVWISCPPTRGASVPAVAAMSA